MQTAAGTEAPVAGRMAEGVEAPQSQRATLRNGFGSHGVRTSTDACHCSEMGPGQGQNSRSRTCEPEEQDDHEEEPSRLPKEGLYAAGRAVERFSG